MSVDGAGSHAATLTASQRRVAECAAAATLALLAALVLAWAGVRGGGEASLAPQDVALRVDLNRATRAELELLPGVGPALAERIVADREARGAFMSVEDLDRVRGIGERTLLALRPFIGVATDAPAAGASEAGRGADDPALP